MSCMIAACSLRRGSAPAQTGANLTLLKATHHHPSSTARSNRALVSCEFLMLQEVPENGVTLSSLRVRYAPFGESPRDLPRSGSSLSQPLRESERLARDGDDDTVHRSSSPISNLQSRLVGEACQGGNRRPSKGMLLSFHTFKRISTLFSRQIAISSRPHDSLGAFGAKSTSPSPA